MISLLCIALLVTVVLATSDVIVLTNDNFDKLVKPDSTDTWLLEL